MDQAPHRLRPRRTTPRLRSPVVASLTLSHRSEPKREWAGHLEGVEKVYAVVEPDEAGERLAERLAESFDSEARLHLVRLPFGAILYLYFDPDPYDGIPGEYSWCRVNDRGPDPATGRSLDISLAVAEDLGLEWYGVGLVGIYRVE